MSAAGEHLTVDGVERAVRLDGECSLLVVLREQLDVIGPKPACGEGTCGACTVLLDGEPVRSCLMFAVTAQEHDVTTVEGLAEPDGTLGPVQQAFVDCHALQCGFCTPGYLCTVTAFLREHPDPSDAEILEAVGGNLCRCTGYQNIKAAVRRAAGLRTQHAGR
jgi:aerobic carbon-monoxide dehydrogenase small subunit